MKRLVLTVLCLIPLGCVSETVIDERMVISPRILVFAPGDSLKTVSITHTCSCPFTWTLTPEPAAPWLIIPTGPQQGDNSSVHFAIDTSKLATDAAYTLVRIASNSYGSDSIQVTAMKK